MPALPVLKDGICPLWVRKLSAPPGLVPRGPSGKSRLQSREGGAVNVDLRVSMCTHVCMGVHVFVHIGSRCCHGIMPVDGCT